MEPEITFAREVETLKSAATARSTARLAFPFSGRALTKTRKQFSPVFSTFSTFAPVFTLMEIFTYLF